MLDRPVKHPELWGLYLGCAACGWHTSPHGPWRIRDCLRWPEHCPECRQPLVMRVPECPYCRAAASPGSERDGFGDVLRRMLTRFRIPRTWRAAMWGDYTCRHCGRDYDKWGRVIESAG